MHRHELIQFDVLDIHVGDRQRTVADERVAALASSIREIGLQTPISVRIVPEVTIDGEIVHEVPVLIAGATRLAAVKSLGWEKIDCFLLGANDLEAQLWEIDENLARSELTPAETAGHMTRRAELWKLKGGKIMPTLGGSQKIGFARDTAEKTGQSKRAVNQALSRGAKIAPDVLKAVTGTDRDKGVHLDRLAKMTPTEQRAEIVKPIAPPPAEPLNDIEISNKFRRRLAAAWNSTPPSDREWFRDWIDTPAAKWTGRDAA